MTSTTKTAFEDIPRGAGGHFTLLFYTAVYRLVDHIRGLGQLGGDPVETVFGRYPFLLHYTTEMKRRLPEATHWEQLGDQWQGQLSAWEAGCEQPLPFSTLTRDLDLDARACLALVLIGLVEEDSRFGTVFAELQAPLLQRRPTLELVGRILAPAGGGGTSAWVLCRPLLDHGLVECLDDRLPRSEWVLRVPGLIWDALGGRLEARPAPGCRYHPARSFPAIDELIFPATFLDRLHNLHPLLLEGRVQVLMIRSSPGGEPREVLGAMAAVLGRGLMVLDGTTDPGNWKTLAALCTLADCLPVLSYDPGPGETVRLPELVGYRGPVGVLLGQEGGLTRESMDRVLSLSLPLPDFELRRQHWQRTLGDRPVEDLNAIAGTFQLAGGYIRQLGPMAVTQANLDGRQEVTLEDVRRAGRSLNRQVLDTLASYLEAQGGWDTLVTAEATLLKLQELTRRCRQRERLLERLGEGFGNSANRGVRVLFTGVSGTGKTLAARILAAELGMDLYRVDLAAVINKYIGETEKNLHRVLSYAEALDVILLLDEGDALLGNRTEVKSANDRYANLETNYLLQRLENYQGIVVVTTNLADNVDRAFQRRMDVVVSFLVPQAEERRRILTLHLPPDHLVDEGYLERVGRCCQLSGGQLRNVALHAALLALDQGCRVDQFHLQQALQGEYRKNGAIFPLLQDEPADTDDGVAAFVAALQQ